MTGDPHNLPATRAATRTDNDAQRQNHAKHAKHVDSALVQLLTQTPSTRSMASSTLQILTFFKGAAQP